MALDPTRTMPMGCPVFTQDGDRIGQVKEIDGPYFKVDATMQPDYWLRTDCVMSYTADRVTLSVDKDHLGDAKVDRPEMRG
jgi:rRNA processing protein Gar1